MPLTTDHWPLATDHSPGLYVHIPFCKSKCPYCDFYSIPDASLIPAFMEALEQEGRLYRDQFPAFDSLYLGGGTPSLLIGPQLTALMACLRRHFSFSPDCEVTVEANPDDLTPEKLAVLKSLGVNRLSVGVQSFDNRELGFLGRRHKARQTEQALKWVRAAGFTNLGVDLIYGLPGQRAEAWLKNLKRALEFRPEHLSCYQLTLEPGTPLGDQKAKGQIHPLPEETERELFLLTSRFLAEQGYIHYEVSNFARNEAFCSRHNRKYWRHVPYLGLGPAAHSFHGGKRWWNHRSLEQYCRALREGVAPVAGSETLSAAQRHLESLYLGLRTKEGVALDLIRQHPHCKAILAELEGSGLARVAAGRVAPTLKGFLVADRLPLWFAE